MIICGHCDKINLLTGKNWEDELLNIAERNGKMIYTFDYYKTNSSIHICMPKVNGYK